MNKLSGTIILCMFILMMSGCWGGSGSSDEGADSIVVLPTIKTLHEESLLLVDDDYTDTCYVEDITCDESGRTMVDKLHYGGGSVFSITFAYDGELLVRKDCGFEGQDTASIYYSYDDEGRLQSVSDNKHPMPIETYLYDENGRKEWTFTHDGESDSIISSYHTQYDLLGRVEEEVQYGVEFENQVLETHTYTYDSDGNLKEEKVENADGVTLVLYEYDEYDEFGSWTLCYKTEYQVPSSNGKKTRTTRILTYY